MKILIAIAFILCSCTFKTTVKTVIDGDSFYLVNGDEVRLRFADAPEATRGHIQPFGLEAAQYTRKYLQSQEVTVKTHGRDKYNRIIADVYLSDGRYFNEMLVKAGLAYVYKKYSPAYLYNEELEAKRKRIGLWSEPSIAPFIFRQRHKR